jgi:hypothetical protein
LCQLPTVRRGVEIPSDFPGWNPVLIGPRPLKGVFVRLPTVCGRWQTFSDFPGANPKLNHRAGGLCGYQPSAGGWQIFSDFSGAESEAESPGRGFVRLPTLCGGLASILGFSWRESCAGKWPVVCVVVRQSRPDNSGIGIATMKASTA